jgi:UDP-glucose:glycoprotein glucosyltransferase
MHPVHSGPADSPPSKKSNAKARKDTALGSAKRFVLDTNTETDVGAETITYDIPPKWNDLLDGIVDSSDRLEGAGTIVWWNDIEEDTRYADWRTDLTQVGSFPVFFGRGTLTLFCFCYLHSSFALIHLNSLVLTCVYGLTSLTSSLLLTFRSLVSFPSLQVKWTPLSPVGSLSGGDLFHLLREIGMVREIQIFLLANNTYCRARIGLKMARIVYYIAQKFGQPQLSSFFRAVCPSFNSRSV